MSENERYNSSDDFWKEISKRIKKLRIKKEYKTQVQFADALGISSDKIKQREALKTPYSLKELICVCNLFHCDMDCLLGRMEEETRETKDLKEITGLSEKACNNLLNYGYSQNNRKIWIDFISRILEDEECDTLFQSMSELSRFAKDYSFIHSMGFTKDTTDELKESLVSKLWYMSYVFSNIIDHVFSDMINNTKEREGNNE